MQSTLFMICGLPGSGKTTIAKQLENEHSALRFSPDEWILALHGHELERPERNAVRDPMEALQWSVAKRALSVGCNVVLDWGFWSKEERTKYRTEAESIGAKVKVIFLNVPLEELWKRISNRPESLKGTLHITQEELEEWSHMFEAPTPDELN